MRGKCAERVLHFVRVWPAWVLQFTSKKKKMGGGEAGKKKKKKKKRSSASGETAQTTRGCNSTFSFFGLLLILVGSMSFFLFRPTRLHGLSHGRKVSAHASKARSEGTAASTNARQPQTSAHMKPKSLRQKPALNMGRKAKVVAAKQKNIVAVSTATTPPPTAAAPTPENRDDAPVTGAKPDGPGANGPLTSFLSSGGEIPILLLAKNRPEQLKKTLKSLLGVRGVHREKVFIAQDGTDPRVGKVAEEFKIKLKRHVQKKTFGPPWKVGAVQIATHYKWSLGHFFNSVDKDSPAVIIVEDDLRFSPDFYEYFAAVSRVLDSDQSLWIASAWNDNGFKSLVKDNYQLKRTIFFPGLGWMLTRRLFKMELERKWPREHWDHWLRQKKQHNNREVLYPQVPRVFHAGIKGTFMEKKTHAKYFARIATNNDSSVNWNLNANSKAKLALEMAEQRPYKDRLEGLIQNSLPFSTFGDFNKVKPGQTLAIWINANLSPYRKDFEPIANFFGIWHEHQRGSHCGVHEFYWCKLPPPGSKNKPERIQVMIINVDRTVPEHCNFRDKKPKGAQIIPAGFFKSNRAGPYSKCKSVVDVKKINMNI